ncbi:MAG: ATP-binding protein [Rhizobacter sp.]|nr:ATP-binding protein [Chlorobiales bacterium]
MERIKVSGRIMFKELEIENFRGIKKLHIGDLRKVNLLVGRNNSGKTTVLESLGLLSQPLIPTAPVTMNAQRQILIEDENYWESFFYNLSESEAIKLHARISFGEEKEEERELTVMRYSMLVSSLSIEGIEKVSDELLSDSALQRRGLSYHLEYGSSVTEKNTIGVKVFRDGDSLKVEPAKTSQNKPQRFNAFFYSAGITHHRNETVLNAFDEIQVKQQTQRLIALLRKVEPAIEGLEHVGNSIYVRMAGITQLLPLGSVGDGLLKLLTVFLFMSKTANGLILIDEIDNGLHVSAQEILWKAVFEAAKEFNVQVFATTHSWECVGAFANAEGLGQDDTRLFRINKIGEESFATDYRRELLQGAVEENIEVR